MRGIKLGRLVSIIQFYQIPVAGLPKLSFFPQMYFSSLICVILIQGPKFHCTLAFLAKEKKGIL